jgi:FKBP-type peptidyl-prolyl cis-trans isomerase FkpA
MNEFKSSRMNINQSKFKKMKNVKMWIIALTGILFFACGGNSDRGFQKSESGISYKIHEQGGGEKPQLSDILKMEMIYRIQDSILFDTRQNDIPMFLELIEPEFPGDIYEAFAMLTVGDSATFIVDASDFFMMTAGMFELPPFIQEGDELYFDVRLDAAMDEEEFMEEQQRIMEAEMRANEQRAMDEEGIRDQFLEDMDITVQPLESGLYYIETEQGSGPRVTAGSTVYVHYEGRLIDGTVFDTSHERGEPLDFVVGTGQVIPGWDEGISQMNVGGKAMLVIPSNLAYGDRGAGALIPPFSTLVFEVEVVDVR